MGLNKTEEVIKPSEVRYKGIIDWGGLYRLILAWFNGHKYSYIEKRYKDKVATPFGNELEIQMRPFRKVTEFVRFRVEVDIKIWDFKEFETEKNNQKVMVTDGRILIRLTGYVDFDYTGTFKTPFEQKLLKILLSVFSKYFEFKYISNLASSIYDLQSQIKDFLGMETTYYGYGGAPG